MFDLTTLPRIRPFRPKGRELLGVIVLKARKINSVQFETAILYQKLSKNRGKEVKLGKFLIDHGCITQRTLIKALQCQEEVSSD